MTLAHITLSEFQSLLQGVRLPLETMLTVTFEDEHAALMLKRQKAVNAMRKLRGSGNGNLVNALLQERKRERERENRR